MTSSGRVETDRPVGSGKRPGGVIAIVGGVLAGLAYLVLPVATVPLLGSITAPSLAGEVGAGGSLALLPLVPVAAAATIGIGLWLWLGSPGSRARTVGASGILLCSVLTALAYLIPLNSLDNEITSAGADIFGISATTFTGTGFWFTLLGAVLAAVGAAVELAGRKKST
jgi:hypothetical protein